MLIIAIALVGLCACPFAGHIQTSRPGATDAVITASSDDTPSFVPPPPPISPRLDPEHSRYLIAASADEEREPPKSNKAKLTASLKGKTLTIKLTNTGDAPFSVDRELVFLMSVGFLNADRKTADRYVEEVPRSSKDVLLSRFVRIAPGQSVSRTMDLTRRWKSFGWVDSIELGQCGYENYYELSPGTSIRQIEFEYRGGFAQTALGHYVGSYDSLPQDLLFDRLDCRMQVNLQF